MHRREFLQFAVTESLVAWLVACGLKRQDSPQQATAETPIWPKDQQEILAKIEALPFLPGCQLKTTFFPRKMMWEAAELLKVQGKWPGGDESDWLSHQSVIEGQIAALAAAGFRGGRLTVVPFELTQDGKSFNWNPLETALKIMKKYGLVADLCIGPLDFPYYPGIRVPQNIEQELRGHFADRGKSHITISLKKDRYFPELNQTIQEYALGFLQSICQAYGTDSRIDKLYLGNEWPDTHGIEGVEGTMSIDDDLMQAAIEILLRSTNKPVTLNTNIHPSELNRINNTFKSLFDQLGSRGVLGIDTYPTQEVGIASYRGNYGDFIRAVQGAFPATQLVFTEVQAEPWPPGELAGRSWAEIYKIYPRAVIGRYYEQVFPPTLETHVLASGLKEIGLWGAPLWPIVAQLGYNFPLNMLTTVAQSMVQAK